MRVVLDTNILLISLPTISKYRPIFNSIIKHKIELIISNEVLTEYIEKIQEKTNSKIATNLAELLTTLRNVIKIDPYFQWELIENDPDDNKFADISIAGNADYLVTNDKHFNRLKLIEFPKVNVILGNDFLSILKELKLN